MTALRVRQVLTLAWLEAKRAFLSKRSLWVYLLALFPAFVFFMHGLNLKLARERLTTRGVVSASLLDSVKEGESDREVVSRLGKPGRDSAYERRRRGEHAIVRRLEYFDGSRSASFVFINGVLESRRVRPIADFQEDRQVYAFVFRNFYLRVAVFFGCLGIFMNLFRGKMMDKTLHFWLLAPLRREVLLAGKYLAGLVAASVIFGVGALLSFRMMLWENPPGEVMAFWQQHGPAYAFSYAAAAVLACVGYGSVFLASGLLVRNPIVPAAVLLLWEGANPFLPTMLQKISVIHYVQALCPVVPPPDPDMPALAQLLFSPATPPSKLVAVLGLLLVTALVLWLAARAVRRLEINYSTD